jgi:hypothetical protein
MSKYSKLIIGKSQNRDKLSLNNIKTVKQILKINKKNKNKKKILNKKCRI